MPDIPDDNWSERDDRNAEVVPNGFPPGLPAGIELIGQMMMGAIKRFWNKINPVYLTSGPADIYVVTPEGQTVFLNLYEIIRVRINLTNATTTPTLKFGRTAARTIVKVSGAGTVPLVAGDLLAGKDASFWFNGTNFVLSNPATVDSSSTIGLLKVANNLSDVANTASSRTNIGLGNVDNTSDVNKPVSTAQQTALNLKADLSSPALTGNPTAPTQTLGDSSTKLATTAFVATAVGAVQAAGAFLQGFIYGLTLSNSTADASNALNISVGSASSSDSTSTLMNLLAATGKTLSSTWVVGGTPASPLGGLDTGTVSAAATYHVWLIMRPDTGVVDVLFSLSATAPTMPTNYTLKRRIGSILRTGSVIVPFLQRGDQFLKVTQTTDYSATSAITNALLAFGMPVGIQVQPILSAFFAASTTATISVGDGGNATATAILAACAAASGSGGTISSSLYTNTSAQIRLTVTGTITSMAITTSGWTDQRGRSF